MLRISDLRLWNRLANTSTSVAAIEQTEPSACEDHTAFPSDRHRIAAREHGYDNPAPESGGVRETVVRYAPGWAQELLAEARRVLSRCPRYTSTPGPTAQDRYEVRYVLERTLPGTGDDALLVRREQQYAGETRIWADYLTVVRVGNAVLTTMHELGEGVAARDVAVRLAGIGANRADCLRSSC